MNLSALHTSHARWAAGVAALAATALLATACSSSGGSGGSSASNGSGAGTGSAGAGAAASGAAVITTASGTNGTYLTDGSGRAVYLWAADSSDKSTCSGACAGVWPPVTTKTAPTVTGSARASELGTIKRTDGSMQVTYDHHPLYYFAEDSGAGQTTGQGSNSFGAKWWLLTPAGAAITGNGSAAPSTGGSSTSSGSGGGGYGY